MNQDLLRSYQLTSLGGRLDFHNVLNKLPGLPWSKYKGEKHLPGYSFVGPGTNLDKRLDQNDNPLPNSVPINRVDAAAYRHDLAYREADRGDSGEVLAKKHEADKKMIEELSNIQNPTFRERIDAPLVKAAIGTKVKLGLGVRQQQQPPSLAKELYKPYRKPKRYLTIKIRELNDIWSADLMFIQNLIVLVVIDCYSRYLWTEIIPNKKPISVKNAFERIVKKAGVTPNKFWTDQGVEFYNKLFKSYLAENNIELYHTFNAGKAVFAERVIRTIKEKMYQMYTEVKTRSWRIILKNVVENYNNTVHSGIKETPSNAFENPKSIIMKVLEHNYKNEIEDKVNKTKKVF